MRNLRKSAAILLTAVVVAGMLVVPGEGAQAAELQENSVSYSTENTTAVQWLDDNTAEEKQSGVDQIQTTEKEQKGHIYKKKGKSYYKYEDGKLAKKKFVTVGKNTCYFNKKGVMEKGWMKKKGNYYYFDRQTGKQKFNCKVDGIKIRKDGTAKLSTYTKNKIDTMITAKKIM